MQLSHFRMRFAVTQDVGQCLPLVFAPLAPLVSVPTVNSIIEQEVVEIGSVDKAPVCKACEVPKQHEMIAGIPP